MQFIIDDWFVELNMSLNFENIQGYPHDILEKAIEKFPISQVNNVVSTINHWRNFKNMVTKISPNHNDIKMRLFAFYL
jgi:hypothetical protein